MQLRVPTVMQTTICFISLTLLFSGLGARATYLQDLLSRSDDIFVAPRVCI